MISYGLINIAQVREFSAAVAAIFPGSNQTLTTQIMVETAAAETQCGTLVDPTKRGAGRGLFQCDDLPFADTINRSKRTDLELIRSRFGIDMSVVKASDLDYSPLLAAIVCRLFYMLRPGSIPATVEERAAYWKKYYNTALGAGTVEHYLESAKRYKLF